jgi:hypothetical protein
MTSTLENLIAILRRRLKDEEFDDNSLTEYLNDSQNEILMDTKWPFLEMIDVYDADETGTINLPWNYEATINIFAKSNHFTRPLRYMKFEDFFSDANAGKFWVYCVFGRELYYRLPEIKETDADYGELYRIKHFYMARPKKLVKSSDRPTLPDEFEEVLILGALARAERERDNFDYAQIFMNQREELLTNLKLRYGTGQLNMANRSNLNWHQNFDY